MNFKTLIRKTEIYLHLQGTQQEVMIKDLINESVLDFLRSFEWAKCKVMEVITLDGSNSYDLSSSAILTNFFQAEIDLMDDAGNTYYKVDYNWYLKSNDKTFIYAILGDTMHVAGDTGDLSFVFLSPGNPHPLVKDNDENLVTKYYYDIIKIMVAVLVYESIGDHEQMKLEDAIASRKIDKTKKHEYRTKGAGKLHAISRTAR